ncbi:MAG TPA: GNAT family protein [Candidatus Limnocylindrales bacterium]
MATRLFRPFPAPDRPLTDGTLVLRLPREADAPAIAAACADPEIARWIPVPVPYRLEDARAFVAFTAEGWSSGREPTFVIADATDGALLGTLAFHRRPDEPGKAAVGYWLAPGARGRGAATGAVLLAVRWAFGIEPALVRMELLTLVGNEASGRVALRAGFTREGVLRRYLPFRGELMDAVMFARLRGDPEA